MTKRPSTSRTRDLLLAAITVAALLSLAAVIVAAPRQAAVPVPVATSPVSTTPASDGSAAATKDGEPTPSSTPSSSRRATPSPTPSLAAAKKAATATDAPKRSSPPTPAPKIARLTPCVEVTPGPNAVRCVTRKRKRTVVLGGMGAPVGLAGVVVSVQQVDVVKSDRRGRVRVRLRGGISLPSKAQGSLPRTSYYFGYGDRRYSSVGGDYGLRSPVVGKGSRYRVAFDIPRSTFKRASRPGATSRFVFAPPGVSLPGMEPVGVIVLNLSAALR